MSDLNLQFVQSQWVVENSPDPGQWNVTNNLKSSEIVSATFQGPPGVAERLASEFAAWKNGHHPSAFAEPSNLGEVQVSVNPTEVAAIGDIITVTAQVLDQNGEPVPDGTLVDFFASDNANLEPIGANQKAKPTMNGVTQVRYVAIGSGLFVLGAAVGDVSGVAVVTSSA